LYGYGTRCGGMNMHLPAVRTDAQSTYFGGDGIAEE
jgi:hypothetical protein